MAKLKSHKGASPEHSVGFPTVEKNCSLTVGQFTKRYNNVVWARLVLVSCTSITVYSYNMLLNTDFQNLTGESQK